MSEIKGQLLGIILVLMLFGTVAGVMTSAFKKLGDTVTEKTEDLNVKTSTISF